MSGKPATPPASRAAVAGAPRLLVYVADPLEARADHRRMGVPDSLYYKAPHDNADKTFGAYGAAENPNAPRVDFFALSQSFVKNQNIKVDNNKVSNVTNSIPLKGDSMTTVEFTSLESFQNRVPLDGSDVQLYQMKCPAGQGTVVPAVQSVNSRLKSVDNVNNILPREKNYMSYQYVESCGVSDGAVSVPLGWRRVLSGTTVIYISPSGTALASLSQLREYLQTSGTCKCGLPCPLRPETVFSFDPKVASKPYQAPTGPELAKLCNHKRKLLATLHARANTTPPPQTDQKKGSEVGVVTKKMKKKSATSNVVNRFIVQKDKHNEYKAFQQDGDHCRAGSPVVQMRINSHSCPPAFSTSQQISANIVNLPENSDMNKIEYPMQRTGSRYLTVNSGWINPEPTQKPLNLNVGQPVLGTNGQIIGVNTGIAKGVKIIQPVEHDMKDDKKVILELSNQQMNQSILKQSAKDEESHVFCGLNQPLTPEVMQKINEQQQIFIQQNQKQIEMAMKGFRSQKHDNSNYGKSQCHNNYVPQGHVVIQSGAVVKTNSKTPPWQVKRSDAQCIPSHSPSLHKQDDEYDDGMMHDDTSGSSSTGNNSFNSSPNNEHINQQTLCSRVPPLPQHYSMLNQQQHWPPESPKKKTKKSKKKASPESKNIVYGNNGLRIIEETKRLCNDPGAIPSFMDDPNGYLAQQTALLNNTISRQVGMPPSYEHSNFDNVNYANIETDKCKMTLHSYRTNMVQNPSPSPNSTTDSSVLSDKVMECCNKGCTPGRTNCNDHYNLMRRNYPRQNVFQKMDSDGSSANSSPKNSGDDNPVTSSTYADRGQYSEIDSSAVSTSQMLESPSTSARSTPTPGTQMMNFISNHNVNKNLMDVGNISLIGVKKPEEVGFADSYNRKRMYNTMPGYCPPPHLGGGPALTLVQASYVQSYSTTMATGFSVTRDTVTSVLAGKAQTATTSINASTANFIRLPPPPSINLATSYAIPNNQPDPFINSVNLPTSYPLHIAGTTAQNMITKSPLEMVQNVIGSLSSSKCDNSHSMSATPHHGRKSGVSVTPSQILISSTKQIMISGNAPMPPPPPKAMSTMSPIHVSSVMSNAAGTMSAPAGGNMPSPTMVVNNLQAPYVLQPSLMAVDNNQVVQQNVLPQMVTGGHVTPRQSPSGSPQDIKTSQSFVQGVAMISPEGAKKKNKKKKNSHATNVTNVLQITAPQQNIMMHHTSPQHNTSPQFSPRGYQLSPNNNAGAMLQALTIVPGKSGAQIVMSGQGTPNNFGSQQIIQNTSPSQQINLLQPVNLLNNTAGVVSNFPAFQQFIVPNIGGMMMTTDGTIIQDNSTGVQLQLQTVNGQNVLTPVQNSGVFAAGTNTGVVIRTQNQQGKIIQSQHSPGAAQFLSPNSQVMMNSPNFNSQLSPLLANLSPTNVTYQNPHQIRSNMQQDFMGQAVMVPLSPKSVNISTSNARNNSTFVQQNTTIVQQQTIVSNPHGNLSHAVQDRNGSRLLSKMSQIKNRSYIELLPPDNCEVKEKGCVFLEDEDSGQHSVSTQTLLNSQRGGKSPGGGVPDTTTLSPLGPLETACSPRLYNMPQHYADTTTKSPEPNDSSSLAMVQCVSSSEQDMAEQSEHTTWSGVPVEYAADNENVMSNVQLMRDPRRDYNQTISVTSVNNQHSITITPTTYYDRPTYKRKNEFTDLPPYRQEKHMRPNYSMLQPPKESSIDYDPSNTPQKSPNFPQRYLPTDNPSERHNLGPGNDATSEERTDTVEVATAGDVEPHELHEGELVWGPVKGYASWPGKLLACQRDGRWSVRWFGADKSLGLVPPDKLLTLTQGLEAHHAARTKHRKSRKLNINLENAIQEAMAELDKTSDQKVDQCTQILTETLSEVTADEEPSRKHTKKCLSRSKKSKKPNTVKNPSSPTPEVARPKNPR